MKDLELFGGTDNHLISVDVKQSVNLTGKQAEETLDSIGITCNKNTIPFDREKPFVTSGIRLGTPLQRRVVLMK